MAENRRTFLKLTGLGALGAASLPAVKALASGGHEAAQTGKRYAMAIDTRKCKPDCKDCSAACHQFHNVPEMPDKKHEVKWIWKAQFAHAFPEQEHARLNPELLERLVPVTCNHCENPPCVRVCPTGATFQRDDGLVINDYHRCIGCRFCMAACPYGARSMNWRDPRPFIAEQNPKFPTRTKGMIDKCNFCDELVGKGEKPLCVSACKEGAMVFGDINDPESEISRVLRENITIRRKPSLGTSPQVYYIV